jgi:DNA-binding MarR family transcriptional regulator
MEEVNERGIRVGIARNKPAKEALTPKVSRERVRLEVVDAETGTADIVRLTPEKLPKRRRPRGRNYGTVYLMVDTLSLSQLTLTAAEYRVLTYIIGRAQKPEQGGEGDTFHDVEIVAPSGVIARDLGIHINNVSKVVSRLVKRNILIRSMQGVYRINRKIAHAGSWKTWNTEANRDPEVDWTGEGFVDSMTGEIT